MNYKILLMGNGFEANYNPKMQNFNKEFINWINSINDISKLKDEIINHIYKITNKNLTINDEEEEIMESFVETIKEDYENQDELLSISIEDYFKELAKKIEYDNANEVGNSNINKIFKVIKLILGYFIDKNTYYENKKLVRDKFKLNKNQKYHLILSTNYTNSPEILSKAWNDKLLKNNVPFFHIHGNFKNEINRYENIEINLKDKSIHNLDEILKKIELALNKFPNENNTLQIDIFGLSIYKDKHILENLMFYLIPQLESDVEINYIYYDENSLKKFDELISKLERGQEEWIETNIFSNSDGPWKISHLFDKNENKLTLTTKYISEFFRKVEENKLTIKINKISKEDFNLYKELQKNILIEETLNITKSEDNKIIENNLLTIN